MDPARRAFYEFHSTLHGAVGRPGLRHLHRRHPHRRGPRPQRPAARAATGSPTTASSCSPPRSACSTSTRPRWSARAGCSRAGCSSSTPSTAGSSTTTRSSPSSPPQHPYDEWLHAGLIHLDGPARARAHRAHRRLGRPAPADLRLHRGGAADPADARWPGPAPSRSARWAPTRPIAVLSEPAAAALRLLHPALRPGHQPAAGRDPRGARHLARHDHRPGGQRCWRRRRRTPASWCCRSRSSTTTSWPRSCTSTPTATCPGYATARGPRPLRRSPAARTALHAAARGDLRRGVRRRSPRRPVRRALRPRLRPRPRADPVAAAHLARCTTT